MRSTQSVFVDCTKEEVVPHPVALLADLFATHRSDEVSGIAPMLSKKLQSKFRRFARMWKPRAAVATSSTRLEQLALPFEAH